MKVSNINPVTFDELSNAEKPRYRALIFEDGEVQFQPLDGFEDEFPVFGVHIDVLREIVAKMDLPGR